jgi:hypothetical protein
MKLFSTIARDLARLNHGLLEHISQVIREDRSVASAGQFRQFDQLILKPCCSLRFGMPVVILIDGLDEGCDRETLLILRNEVPKLPGAFRIIVTSRPTEDILTDLLNASHVQRRSLDIHGKVNQRDITLYIRGRLHYVSSRKHLPADWPGEQRIQDFIRQTEGLFIWAHTASEYLLTVPYPDRKLSALLYDRNKPHVIPERRMDALYTEVLSACAWDDHDFVQDYGLVIGAVIAAKMPLSAPALQSLHRDHPSLDVMEVLRPLNSVLTGVLNKNDPIQILHLSFRDFVTYRARLSVARERFQVNEREHSERLALSCLRILNEDLTFDIPGTGYLSGRTRKQNGIPPLDESHITEVVWYACRFWTEHIIEVEGPVSDSILEPLRQFLMEKVVVWVEVLIFKHSFQSLSGVCEWLQVCGKSQEPLACAQSDSFSENLSTRASPYYDDIQ